MGHGRLGLCRLLSSHPSLGSIAGSLLQPNPAASHSLIHHSHPSVSISSCPSWLRSISHQIVAPPASLQCSAAPTHSSPSPFAASAWRQGACADAWRSPMRSYAAAAAAKGAAASAKAGAGKGAAAAEPKKKRRSETRMYSCRNTRLRHGFEQIWPTVRLKHEQTQDFRRNSRLYVVDMGKSITLRGRYRMATSPMTTGGTPVPHQQGTALLHETDMHLDAVGEHPRYLKIRRLNRQYASRLENLRKLRLLLGMRRRKYMQNLYESSLMQVGPHRTWKLICAMESQFNMFALRCGFAPDSMAMTGVLRGRRLALNGCLPRYDEGTVVQPADILTPAPNRERFFRAYLAHGMRDVLHSDTRPSAEGFSVSTVYRSFF